MILSRPVPFREALDLLRRKSLLPTALGSAEINDLDASITRAATLSARVTDARYLEELSALITRIVNPQGSTAPGTYMDIPRAREILKVYLEKTGYSPDEGKQGTIEDLASDQRTSLVVRMNTQLAQGYGQFTQANDPAVLDAFPAQELFRLENREVPRDWIMRWRSAGGRFFGVGRMIARKDDSVWTAISRFKNPYPPFDYNSGMWTKPVSRADAVALGVIPQGAKVAPTKVAFATAVQVSAAGLSDAMKKAVASAAGATISGDNIIAGGP